MMSRPSSCAIDPGFGRLALINAAPRRTTHLPIGMVVAVTQIVDMALLTSAGILVCAVSNDHNQYGVGGSGLLKSLLPAWVAWNIIQRLGGYKLPQLCRSAANLAPLATAVIAGCACFAACSAIQLPATGASPWLTAGWGALAAGLLVGQRAVGARLIGRWFAEGRIARRLAIVGTVAECQQTVARLKAHEAGAVEIVSLYSYSPEEGINAGGFALWQRRLAQLLASGGQSELDAVIIALPEADAGQLPIICSLLGGLAVNIYVAALPHIAQGGSIDRFGGLVAGLIAARPLSGWQMFQKEAFDRLGALLILLVVWPVFLVIIILVKLDSRGPALFRQQRTGLNNLPFTCFKFRTMFHRDQDGQYLRQAVRGDQRVTRVGRLLRRTSLDELPQLLNVLSGDMSLVGPRPHAPNTTAGGRLFPDIVSDYDHRHQVKPGITGWAQVNGSRGETPNPEAVERRVELDMFYIRNWSLLFDFSILLRTMLCLVHDPLAF